MINDKPVIACHLLRDDIVRVLRSFHLYAFLKKLDMLSQCLAPSITKKVISYWLVLEQKLFIALQKQHFH